jgi:hypothetical protein
VGANLRRQNKSRAPLALFSMIILMYFVPHRVYQPQATHPRTALLDGWRCDLCGEIVTGQERPIAPPEKCARCSSSHITSVEGWAAHPRLGLWTR